MDVRKRLYSNMFFRNMISDLFGRSIDKKSGGFTPYFQYKIGHYNSDYYLYFPKEPYGLQYKNEIFNKLNEFYDSDIANYLGFHYSAYHDKHDFLKFLRYEIYGRLNRKISSFRRQKLLFSQEWVVEKQRELQSQQQADARKEIENQVREVLPEGTEVSPQIIEKVVQALASRFEQLVANTEERLLSVTDSFVTGNIELNNQSHLDGVIKLFKILKDVQAPKTSGKVPEQLFKRFSDTDMAAILRLHFEALKSKQLNSIQKINIKGADERIPNKSPKVKILEEALQGFFY